jgi:hypothetical protein
VTITVNAIDGYFVDAANGNDGTGDFDGGLPFASIQAAVAAAPTGADIVVRPGNYTGAVNLKDGQRLLGSGSALVNAQGANRPQLTGPVVMADGNTLDFLRVEGTNGDAVDGNDQTGGVVSNCEFANTMAGSNGGDGLSGLNTQGIWTVSNNSFTDLAGAAVGFTPIGNSGVFIVSNNVMTGNGASALLFGVDSTSQARASVVANVFRNNNQVSGFPFELVVEDSARFCLDIEDNINDSDSNPNNTDDGEYAFSNSDTGSVLEVEQFDDLTSPKPGGAGNTGSVFVDAGVGFSDPTMVDDGDCGF